MNYRKRLSIALTFALAISAATFFIAQGKSQPEAPEIQQPTNPCTGCHSTIYDEWVMGKHSEATSDPLFTQMWLDQGKPGACLVCHVTGYDPATGSWSQDGVTCEACHVAPPEHLINPSSNPVPVDRSSDLCGRCHSGDRFNIENWQTSVHFQRGMSCTVCHDQHSATLKSIAGQEQIGPSGLCINCHSEVSMNFPYTKHNQAGVSCVDCHLRHFKEVEATDVHAMPDHSFSASISTCSSCHADQMHANPVNAPTNQGEQAADIPQVESTATPGAVASTPSPVSPLGFAGLAGLIGLAGGMVLQPWLERAYRKMNKKDGK